MSDDKGWYTSVKGPGRTTDRHLTSCGRQAFPMIFQPKPGQRVRLHYRKSLSYLIPYNDQAGTILKTCRGPGPRNVLVRMDLNDAEPWSRAETSTGSTEPVLR